MIDFPRSMFTWKTFPWQPDPIYKYAGGSLAKPGDVRHVRFNIEAKCEILDEASGKTAEFFVGAPCRTEYTIPRRNLFQVPSSEFRMAFSHTHRIPIAKRPSNEAEAVTAAELATLFQEHRIDIRQHTNPTELREVSQVISATLANGLLNARSSFYDEARKLRVTVEYPVNLINVSQNAMEFQVCTGPLILPDLKTWNGQGVDRVFLAHAAFSAFDYVEFILQREVNAAPEERQWLDQPRGRDRYELRDPNNPPPGYPPERPRPTVYNEVLEYEATNVVLAIANT
jgi:hypothetical protein